MMRPFYKKLCRYSLVLLMPSVFYFLGTANTLSESYYWHSPQQAVGEYIVPYSIKNRVVYLSQAQDSDLNIRSAVGFLSVVAGIILGGLGFGYRKL